MRVIQISYADPEKIYNKSSLEDDINVSVRTFERYLLDDELKSKTINVGRSKLYKGSDVNKKIDEALDRKSTRLNSSHVSISYAVFCLKKKKRLLTTTQTRL